MTKKVKIIIGISAGAVAIGTTLFFLLRKKMSSSFTVSDMTPGPNIYGFHWTYGTNNGDVDPTSIGNAITLDANYTANVTSYSGITAPMLNPSNVANLNQMIKAGNGAYVLTILKGGKLYKTITVTKNGSY